MPASQLPQWLWLFVFDNLSEPVLWNECRADQRWLGSAVALQWVTQLDQEDGVCVYNIIYIIYMLLLGAPLLSLISILFSHFFIFFLPLIKHTFNTACMKPIISMLIDSNWNNPLTPTLSSSTTGIFAPIFSHSLPLSSRWLGANAELPYGWDTCDVL